MKQLRGKLVQAPAPGLPVMRGTRRVVGCAVDADRVERVGEMVDPLHEALFGRAGGEEEELHLAVEGGGVAKDATVGGSRIKGLVLRIEPVARRHAERADGG